jgi:hypothetical protein
MNHNSACPFCGILLQGKRAKQGAKSDEHIMAQWLLDHLDLRKESVTSQRVDVPLQRSMEVRHFAADRFVNGRICRACNNGWMSQLEGRVKPILIRLLADAHELGRLTQEERIVVATWTLKTAAVLNKSFGFGDPSDPLAHPIPDRHLKAIRSGELPDDILIVGSGCASNYRAGFIQNAPWAAPEKSIPLQERDRKGSYKIGFSLGSLLLGVAYFPNSEYYYVVRQGRHSILWGSPRRVVIATDGPIDVPVLANLPVLEGFLGNILLVSQTWWDLTQNSQQLHFIAQPRIFRGERNLEWVPRGRTG